jgi:hypothetical protein
LKQIKEVSRGFKGIWIPREIWFSENLTYAEIILLSEINSLDADDSGCTASNEYLAKFMGISERVIREHLSNLRAKNYINQVSFNGRVRGLRVLFPPGREEEKPAGREEEFTLKSDNLLLAKKNKDKNTNKPDTPAWRSEYIKRAKDWFYRYSPHLLATESDWKREMPFIVKLVKEAEQRAPGRERQEEFTRDILDIFSDICEGLIPNLKYLKDSLQLMPRHLMSTKIWPLVLGEYENRKGK